MSDDKDFRCPYCFEPIADYEVKKKPWYKRYPRFIDDETFRLCFWIGLSVTVSVAVGVVLYKNKALRDMALGSVGLVTKKVHDALADEAVDLFYNSNVNVFNGAKSYPQTWAVISAARALSLA